MFNDENSDDKENTDNNDVFNGMIAITIVRRIPIVEPSDLYNYLSKVQMGVISIEGDRLRVILLGIYVVHIL